MNNFLEIIKNTLIAIYILGISYLMIINESVALIYNLPFYIIPVVFFISITFFVYKYIKTYTTAKNMEYEFTSIVNHTFRTPLTRIMWLTKELEKDMPINERLLYAQNINNATSKILDIVDLFAGIKNVNDTSGYFFEATSIRDMVEKSLAKYREEINKKNLSFNVSTFKEIPMITVDLKKITFVIDSIIENAVFYTPNGGKVLIDSMNKKKFIEIIVSDNGVGLSITEKMRLFSRFFRTKNGVLMNPDGMGLKLYLSRQIIKRHKGRIYATSKGKDKGSTFFVELPFIKKK